MLGHSTWCRVLFALVALQVASPLLAAPPWAKLAMFKHMESDPGEMYPLTDRNGPWLIMATSFSGDGAEDQARQLIHELRTEYKLPAYSYHKKFEFSKPVEGKGHDAQGKPLLMRYNRDKDYVEIAVLVGDYASVDDPEAQKVLKKLKRVEPKTLKVEAGKSTFQSLAGLRTLQRQVQESILPEDSDVLKKGPMGNAFVITNPLLPNEYFVPKGLDPLIVEMNKEVQRAGGFSLLECPNKYTVKVATFTGHAVIIDQKRKDAIDRGEMPKSYLEDAAKSAHLLTEALRKKGYQAYEFHDRSMSIVTVGGFDTVGSKRDDGKIEINPAIHTIIRTFSADTKIEPGKEAQVGKPRKLVGIPFDVQAMPVEVPKQSLSSVYARANTLRQ